MASVKGEAGTMRAHRVWGGCMMVPSDAEVTFSASTGSPIAVSRCTWRGAGGTYRRSAGSYRRIDHNVLIFVFVDRGGIVCTPADRYPALAGGQFAQIGPMTGIFTTIQPDPGAICSIMSAIVPAHLLRPLLPGGAVPTAPMSSARGHGLVARNLAASLCEAGGGLGEGTVARLCALLVDSLAACIVDAGSAASALPEAGGAMIGRRFAQISAHLDRTFHRPDMSARTLAADMRISPRYLTMILSGSGTSFPALLRARRLAEARRLLREPALAHHSIADIAAMTGIADPAYFSKLFKAAEGRTPVQFRKDGAAAAQAGT